MADVATQVPEQPTNSAAPEQQIQAQQQPDFNQQLASSLWGEIPIKQAGPIPEAANTDASQSANTPTPAPEEVMTVDVDEYFKTNFGVDFATAKTEWEELRKIKNAPPATPQEIQWANDESKRIHEAIRTGNTKEVYAYLHKQEQLAQAENMSAADAIKLHIRLTNPHYKAEDIADVFEEKYSYPAKPIQDLDETDEGFHTRIGQYNQVVEKINRRIERDAFTAKDGLSQLKSQIALPDIPLTQPAQQQPDQKELEAKQLAMFENFKKSLESNYQNFKGFSVTAKDGDVQLPINYAINPDELIASKQQLENFNVNEFLDKRWFDEQGSPNITQMQEDLYLLTNKDKVFQKIANEAASQRFLHHTKIQNNINLNGVNQEIAPSQVSPKDVNQQVAEQIWKF